MALYLAQYIDNPLTYDLWPGFINPSPSYVWDKYNPFLRTPPRIYNESISSIKGFFYVPPPHDIFVLWTMEAITLWPGWNVVYWRFDAGTGELKEKISAPNVGGIVYIGSVEWGDLNHLYATFSSTVDCYAIDWETGASLASLWKITPYQWNPSRIFSQYLVNRKDDKILGVNYPYVDIWQHVTHGTPALLWEQRLPENVNDLAYESRQYGWIITTGGKILKIDWGTNNRIEMISSVQAYNPTDKGYYLAYDSHRQRLAVYRWMPDATDGAARNRIEWYETIPKPARLTEPVPVTSHRTNESVRLVSNLIGDMGEGFAGAKGTAELVVPNNHGKILSPNVVSGINGEILISYQAPATPNTDTIKVTVNYSETLSIEGGVGPF